MLRPLPHNDVRVHPHAPVIALDIDGTIARYHDHFQWFCETIYWPGRRLRCEWDELERFGDFAEALGLDRASEYRPAKLAYRQGGLKRCIPAYGSVRHNVQFLRQSGIQVWITTTRPFNRLDNIDPDTQYWLGNNTGRVDGVIFGEDKYADLVDIVGRERILGVFDDLPENVERAAGLGLKAALRMGEHNAWWVDKVWSKTWGVNIFSETEQIQELSIDWKRAHAVSAGA